MYKLLLKPLLFLLLLTSIFTSDLLAQKKLDAKLLQEDLNIFKEIMTGLSPKLTEEDKVKINQTFKESSDALAGTALTAIEFVDFLSAIEVDSKLDEHAAIGLRQEVLMPLLMESKLLPLHIKLVGEKALVNSDSSVLPYGSIVHSINGEPMLDVLKSLTRDFNSTFSKKQLEDQFAIRYLVKRGSIDTFQLTYSTLAEPSTIIEKTIKGIEAQRYIASFKQLVYPLEAEKLDKPINTSHFNSANAYYLQVNSFNWEQNKGGGLFNFLKSDDKKFDKEFKRIFAEINTLGVQNLIIDLRFNSGGDVRVPGTLYKYITKKAFSETVDLEMQDFDFPQLEHLKQVGSTKVKSVKDANSYLKQHEKHFQKKGEAYAFTYIDNEEKERAKNAFDGNVYLLVGGRSMSATSYFTALFKADGRGTILGEELGGSHHSITAGQNLKYRLPNTEVEIIIPIMIVNFGKSLYQQVPEQKIKPDIQLSEQEAIRYFKEKKDMELEKMLEVINNKN